VFERIREDWAVYDGDIARQGLWVMLVYRFGVWRYSVKPAIVRRAFSFIYRVLKVVSQVLSGIDLPCETRIGHRLRFDHFGGIIISGDTVIGDDVIIRNGVTIGLRRTEERGSPSIGNRVDIGTGAKVLGPITVGDDSVIGANAVVIRDVPAGHVAVGIPARIFPRTDRAMGQLVAFESQKINQSAIAVLLLAILCGFGAAKAQNVPLPAQNPAKFQATYTERPLSPAEALAKFDAITSPTYEFGIGDEITIEIWNRPELSGKQIIGPDGIITLPLIGSVSISGMSRDAAVEDIKTRLSAYYDDLSVNIRVEHYSSNHVFILGRVDHAGALEFDTAPTLLEALARSGALPVSGAASDKAALNRCAVIRGRDAIVWVDLKALLKDGNLAYNLQLKRNDVIYIPDADDQLVYVLGEVQHPGAIRLTPEMTLLDAFSQTGGLNKDGVGSHIVVVRPSQHLRQEISLNQILKGDGSENFNLRQGDIIYVPRRGMAKVGYTLEQFSPLSSWIVLGSLLKP
jgi:protein involved in polysaccharide export with SLBB domain/serine acetyltransferase